MPARTHQRSKAWTSTKESCQGNFSFLYDYWVVVSWHKMFFYFHIHQKSAFIMWKNAMQKILKVFKILIKYLQVSYNGGCLTVYLDSAQVFFLQIHICLITLRCRICMGREARTRTPGATCWIRRGVATSRPAMRRPAPLIKHSTLLLNRSSTSGYLL